MIIIDLNSVKDIHKEARRLIADGLPDQPFECHRDGVKVMDFKSLKWAADHIISESPNLHVEKYREFDPSVFKSRTK